MSDISDADEGWEAAVEHGGKLEEWILDQEGFSHERFDGRDEDGRFNTKFDTRRLSRMDD